MLESRHGVAALLLHPQECRDRSKTFGCVAMLPENDLDAVARDDPDRNRRVAVVTTLGPEGPSFHASQRGVPASDR